MITRIPMTAEHFEFIVPDPVFEGFKARMNCQTLLNAGQSMAWVDREAGEVLAVGGYVLRRPSVAWMWFLPSRRGSHMLLRMARFFQQWVSTLDDGIRIEAAVLADFPAGLRWVEFLGLKRETGDEPMRKWDGRSDYHLYARVIGDDGNDE